MRRAQPQPKERRRVVIPAELRESLAEVWELIQQARHDPDVVLGYDDAIQVGAVCGGRFGAKPRPFVLTYFPAGDAERGPWHLTLHRTEIEDIADGCVTEIALYCCTSPGCRCKFREADERCFFCDYVEDPEYGTFRFPEAAERLRRRGVRGVSEASTREDVIAALGPPDRTGGGVTTPPLGYVGPWVAYRREDCRLRFGFDERRRITDVTILEATWEPGT